MNNYIKNAYLISVSFLLSAQPTKSEVYSQSDGKSNLASVYLPTATLDLPITGAIGTEKSRFLRLQPGWNEARLWDVYINLDSIKVKSFIVNGTVLRDQKDFKVVSGMGDTTINANEIVFLGYGISEVGYDDLEGVDLSGKVVMFFKTGEPRKDGKYLISGSDTPSGWTTLEGKKLANILSKRPALLLTISGPIIAPRTPNGFTSGQALQMNNGNHPAIIDISFMTADKILKSGRKTIAELRNEIDLTRMPKSQIFKVEMTVDYYSAN